MSISSREMLNRAVIFVTDIGFLAPTLCVCEQLLAQNVNCVADIIVYTVDIDLELIEKLRSSQSFDLVHFEPLLSRSFIPATNTHFHKNHVPVVSLARLVLSDVIPEKYDHIIYLDGDLQIVGDIKDLVLSEIPKGYIAAGLGSAWLEENGNENTWQREYLRSLGDIHPGQYYNAGVLAFQRSTWIEVAPKALNFFFENSNICVRHDQSALNAATKNKVIFLNPIYNFHSAYSELYLHFVLEPRIIHFTGPNKPWKSTALPWGGKFIRTYSSFLDRNADLRPYLQISGKDSFKAVTSNFWAEILKLTRRPRYIFRAWSRFIMYTKRSANKLFLGPFC